MRFSFLAKIRALRSADPVYRRFALIAGLAALTDLATKEWAVRGLGEHGLVPLTERFSLFLVWNTGVAGGASVGPFTWLLNVLVTVAALYLVLTVVRPLAAVHPISVTSLGLVSGGAVGNLASMMAGPPGVADFLAVRVSDSTTMVANVADLHLWTGALLLAPVAVKLLQRLRDERAQRRALPRVEMA